MAKKKKNNVDKSNVDDAAPAAGAPAAASKPEDLYCVTLHGSGPLVSHPPVFSTDSSLVYVVQSSSLLVYSAVSGVQVGRFTTAPSFAPIANVHCVSESLLIVVTCEGAVLHLHPTSFEPKGSKQQQISFSRVNQHGGGDDNNEPLTTITQVVSSSLPVNTAAAPGENNNHHHRLFILCEVVGYTSPWLFSVILFRDRTQLHPRVLCRDVMVGHRTVASCGNYVVCLQESSCLFVKETTGSSSSSGCNWHRLGGGRNFTCVDAKVDGGGGLVVATGDDTGRVVLWHNVVGSGASPAKTVLHWHTLPVPSIHFSHEGAHVLSGGGECVLVLWSLVSVGSRRTIPRLGMPIVHVTCSPDCSTYAVAHNDNTLSLVSANSQPTVKIQNILQGQQQNQSFLKVDSGVSGALVMPGRPGHLQFYHPATNTHLTGVDVVGANYVTGERGGSIPNAEVVLADFQGEWLATVEARRDEDDRNNCLSELRLKFWRFIRQKQTWSLSTSVEWPHESDVTDLKLQPHNNSNDVIICVTSSSDCFKTWALVKKGGGDDDCWWCLDSVSEYRGLPCAALAFSNDNSSVAGGSSLIAAGFGPYVTLWESCDPGGGAGVKGSLKHSLINEDVTKLSFGGGHVSSIHLVVSATKSTLAVWDVITCSLLWAVPSFNTSVVATHTELNLAAAFSINQDLIVFELTSREPVGVFRGVSSSRVTAATFVGSTTGGGGNNKAIGTLMFVNEKQELGGLLPKNNNSAAADESSSSVVVRVGSSGSSSLTPFGSLLAERVVREDEEEECITQEQHHRGSRVGVVLREVMEGSPSVMGPVTYYAQQVVHALSRRKVEGEGMLHVERAVKEHFSSRRQMQQQMEKEEEEGEEQKQHEELSPSSLDAPLMSGVEKLVSEDASWILKAV